MPLPHADRAVVDPRKLSAYLLNVAHPVGGPKARFFLAMGFAAARADELGQALLRHAQLRDVVAVRPSRFGDLYELRCAIEAPDGSAPCIRSVWQLRPAGPRLITAYPT